ncbi:hypothetical protein QTP81_07430 [Alteromonas sp. ASW11-36]|uniref:Uncharacterized protein n=1 Tax=Alteromonas arenosi TaxID=3055817 RepID=A0ABT7SW54_9ALTE|nr:hypothetical protein [Alteromonas sp. ASW11-36]MDM7860423.1 hypothetical protein [Alteromonas sp. ASW11-36]
MTTPAPTFTVQKSGDVLWVKLKGQWNVSADLNYLTQLSANMGRIRNQPWGMIIDMREWLITDLKVSAPAVDIASIDLDRRNQVLEAWWQREVGQADFLAPFVTRQKSIDFVRSQDEQVILTSYQKHGLSSERPSGW